MLDKTDSSSSPSAPPLSRKKTRSKFQQDVLRLPKEIRNIAAGGFAGMIAKSVVAPFDRIKILYQISSAEFRIYNVPGVARNIIKTEGWSALWKGNTATMIRVFPYSGIQFMVFDRCKTFFLREQELDYVRRKTMDSTTKRPHWGLSAMESLGSGMIAGAVSVCMTYPLDLTRAQLAVLRRKADHPNIGFYGTLVNNFKSRVRNKNIKWNE
jgi:solute carrier family 25 protein 42